MERAVLAVATVLAVSTNVATAQAADSSARIEEAHTAAERLDFRFALAGFETALDADPSRVETYLERAAIHREMRRPALAIADYGRVLVLAPGDARALRARGATWLDWDEPDRALADLDRVLAAAPDDVEALTLRARAHAATGLIENALADYDRALAQVPGDAALIAARATLAERAAPAPARRVDFDPSTLMDESFLLVQGDTTAPVELVFVHSATDLAADFDGLDEAALYRAIDAGALRVVNLFTYSGKDSAIWGNLALICAGEAAHRPVSAALRGPTGQAALAAVDATGDVAGFKAVVADAYSGAKVDVALVEDCAFDRGKALSYLARWSAKYESHGWDGGNLFDAWPGFILDGAPIDATSLNAQLAEMAGPGDTPADTTPAPVSERPDTPDAAQDDLAPIGSVDAADPEDTGPQISAETPPAQVSGNPDPEGADLAGSDLGETDGADGVALAESGADDQSSPGDRVEGEAPAADPTTPAPDAGETGDGPERRTAAPSPLPQREASDPGVKLTAALKGVWAPSLVGCIAYTDAIAAPETLDQAMPALNPSDGPRIGTILVTSRRVALYDAAGTNCRVESVEGEAEAFRAVLACRDATDPDLAIPMSLSRMAADGPAPRVAIAFGDEAITELVQCRALGQLGSQFAALWVLDPGACTATAPLRAGDLIFRPTDGGDLAVIYRPVEATGDAPDTADIIAAVDGVALGGRVARWEAGAWTLGLGAFSDAANRLSMGMFLSLAPAAGAAPERAELPLLGSGRAMKALAACAPGT